MMSGEDFTPDELARARRYALVIRWSDADQAWLVSAPELLGKPITHGRTIEEAVAQGEDAVATLLSAIPEYASKEPAAEANGRRYVVAPAPRYGADEVRAIRHRLNLSQDTFADVLNVSRGAVRAWEQGQRSPDGAARRLLELADRQPAALFQAIGESSQAMRWRPRQ